MNKKYILLLEAILSSFALMVFSFFIHYDLPLRLISFVVLMLPAYSIARNLKSIEDLKKITGGIPSLKKLILFSVIGLTGGIVFAVLYRWHIGVNLFPGSIYSFAVVAAFIGGLEELVFRGYIQESVRVINSTFSILFSTFSHTGYKCCLFLPPVIASDSNIGFLAFWTLIAGFLFGTIRHVSKSILPSLIAHALFDILVYAELLRAPWWVW